MTTSEIWPGLFRQAEARIRMIEWAFREREWAIVVREAQEALELLLKALLRSLSIEPPKVHDVGPLLERHSSRLTAWSDEERLWLVSFSSDLAQKRSITFYGDEIAGKGPDEGATELHAREALEGLQKAHRLCSRLLKFPSPK